MSIFKRLRVKTKRTNCIFLQSCWAHWRMRICIPSHNALGNLDMFDLALGRWHSKPWCFHQFSLRVSKHVFWKISTCNSKHGQAFERCSVWCFVVVSWWFASHIEVATPPAFSLSPAVCCLLGPQLQNSEFQVKMLHDVQTSKHFTLFHRLHLLIWIMKHSCPL